MKPIVSVSKTSKSKSLLQNLKKIGSQAVYVGIPATTAGDRASQLTKLAGSATNKKQTRLKAKAASNQMNNAELLYLFSKGSDITHQPPRPVLEAAIQADGNKEPIAQEIAEASKAQLAGKPEEALSHLKRAGLYAENASKRWFTDPRNNWDPNSPFTIAQKGSDKPGIDTGAMKGAITSITQEEEASNE